jgi:uncharacterized membrane protein YgcG
MKNTKMNVAKSLLLIALLCPFALADGDQGSGGYTGDGTTVVTCQTSAEGDQGSGGRTGEGDQGSGGRTGEGDQGSGGLAACEEGSFMDGILDSIYSYLNSMG